MRLFDFPMSVVLLFQGIAASKVQVKGSSSRSLAWMPHTPCQHNSAIFFHKHQGRKAVQDKDGKVPESADVCAELCKNAGRVFFAYFFNNGGWRCKCLKDIPQPEVIRYSEGGVTGQVDCFKDLPVLPPEKYRETAKYDCWAGKLPVPFPACWNSRKWKPLGHPNQSQPGCFNSYTMLWEGFRFCKRGMEEGQEFGMDVPLAWCLRICETLPECIGIKWSDKNYCWLHTSAFFTLTEGSCQGRAAFKKTAHVPEVLPDHLNRRCPCEGSMCQEINNCFGTVLKSADAAQRKDCLDVKEYQGSLDQLQQARTRCDLTLRMCQQVFPVCYQNMTLDWETLLLKIHRTPAVEPQGAAAAIVSPVSLIQGSNMEEDALDHVTRKKRQCR